MPNVRKTALFLTCAVLLWLPSCGRPSEPSGGAPSPKQETTPAPPETYTEVDCDCSGPSVKQKDIEAFLAAYIAATPEGRKTLLADHMKEKPVCLLKPQGDSLIWNASRNFQVIEFRNPQSNRPADIFEARPPYPRQKGKSANMGPIKADAPSPSQAGKCYVFKGFIRVWQEDGTPLDIDPHIGIGCCR
jgi:hypothetical protein